MTKLLFFQPRNIQKQAEAAVIFYKKGVLEHFIHRKTPVLKALFNKVAGLQLGVFL